MGPGQRALFSIFRRHRAKRALVPALKLPESKRVLWSGAVLLALVFAVAYYFFLPVAEVAKVQRGTAIAAVYGTVRIEPAFSPHGRAQTSGFIQLAEPFAAGRGAIGKDVKEGQIRASIPDERTGRQLSE